ncbi:hypothetical protein [Alteromonas sp. KUL49]|uniref:hypothetical protein n=1 Tax=Alteromonas sp. KUL49 TaxID=2480798 RepID=UPI00102F158D|nr:hypothetical protein [Alteromonas sp. KUL49]TAP36868.1 hypothetical protein EYS00_17275 [Alteromonas sp. KUL49]GEA13132.1 hypothetical protein KUL49_35070 [Alteromonas sp. KUL49]
MKYVVFPNQVAVAEVYLAFNQSDYVSSEQFEDKVNHIVAAAIRATRGQLVEQIKTFVASSQSSDISFVPVEKDKKQHLYWTSRCISVTTEQLKIQEVKAMIKDWLKETEVPEHADEIGKSRNESMTWLNYVVVDSEDDDFRISTMTLAQYCYIAHEKCNLALRAAIDSVYAGSKIGDARDCLQETRTQTKLHQIAVNEQTKYLTRPKRALLNAIFESWEYDRLVENGEAMMEICDTKIAEADAKQRTINSQKSDRILFSISLFAVFELLVFLSQYSREVMSRPALDYTDTDKSWILAFIASLDADFIFGLGFFAMLALGITYVYVAREKL